MTPTLQEIIKPVISAETQFPAGSYEHSELLKIALLGIWPKLKALAEIEKRVAGQTVGD